MYQVHVAGCVQHMHNQGADGINKPAEQLVEEADGFAEVFPEHKYEIVAMLQRRHHMARPARVLGSAGCCLGWRDSFSLFIFSLCARPSG